MPNITGGVQTGHSLGLFGSSGFGGAVYAHEAYGGSQAGDSGSYSKGFQIDASRCSGLYGASSTVKGGDKVCRISRDYRALMMVDMHLGHFTMWTIPQAGILQIEVLLVAILTHPVVVAKRKQYIFKCGFAEYHG